MTSSTSPKNIYNTKKKTHLNKNQIKNKKNGKKCAVPGTSGVYRCEVSAEETFETDYREMNITIEGKKIKKKPQKILKR